MPGFKIPKDRVIVLLCINFIGTDKITPLVIGKYLNLRCANNHLIKIFDLYSGKKNLKISKFSRDINKIHSEKKSFTISYAISLIFILIN